MPTTCEMNLPGCFEDVAFVAYLGPAGDCYTCGPCMNASNEPELFVPIQDTEVFERID